MAQIFTTSNMCLEFFKVALAHFQNLSFLAQWPDRGGRSPPLFFGN